jgi:tol-pal system protein YbgF
LKSYPRSELAHEAQYLIGECQYMEGNYQDAVAAYNQVIANFPRSTSAANAYYKRGMAFDSMKQRDRARESFDAAIKMFPDSDAARLAKQALDRINRGK